MARTLPSSLRLTPPCLAKGLVRCVHGKLQVALSPKISVVMPAYNAAEYLDEAIRSILNQTFRDFEFIIINDGSTDDSISILDKQQKLDSRIRVYHQENQGMIAALNRGCRLARGKYIARMDADDISLPGRLEKQLKYMERHPQIGILGTWIYSIDKNGFEKSSLASFYKPKNAQMDSLFWCLCVLTLRY